MSKPSQTPQQKLEAGLPLAIAALNGELDYDKLWADKHGGYVRGVVAVAVIGLLTDRFCKFVDGDRLVLKDMPVAKIISEALRFTETNTHYLDRVINQLHELQILDLETSDAQIVIPAQLIEPLNAARLNTELVRRLSHETRIAAEGRNIKEAINSSTRRILAAVEATDAEVVGITLAATLRKGLPPDVMSAFLSELNNPHS